jgi:hypothetical protein
MRIFFLLMGSITICIYEKNRTSPLSYGTANYSQALTEDRLYAWHAALFPTGRYGMHKIQAET